MYLEIKTFKKSVQHVNLSISVRYEMMGFMTRSLVISHIFRCKLNSVRWVGSWSWWHIGNKPSYRHTDSGDSIRLYSAYACLEKQITNKLS